MGMVVIGASWPSELSSSRAPGLLAHHEDVEGLGADQVDDDLLDDPDDLLVVEGRVELVGGDVEVGEVVVLLLDLDVAVGELLVLLLDLLVARGELGQPLLEIADPLLQLRGLPAPEPRRRRRSRGARS